MATSELGANDGNATHQAVVVHAPSAELYERWRRFEDLPAFMPGLRNVRRIDDAHFAFVAGHNGSDQRGVLEVLLQIPEHRIAWRLLGDDLGVAVVSFEPRAADTTEVQLKLRSAFDPPASAELAAESLSNFKRIAEAGRGQHDA